MRAWVDKAVFGALSLWAASCGLATNDISLGDDPTMYLTGSEQEPLYAAVNGVVLATCPVGKVLICHVPPGNPANEHTICIGQPAVDAHLTHHPDRINACNGQPTPTQGGPDGGATIITCVGYGGSCASGAACCTGYQCIAGVCDVQVP